MGEWVSGCRLLRSVWECGRAIQNVVPCMYLYMSYTLCVCCGGNKKKRCSLWVSDMTRARVRVRVRVGVGVRVRVWVRIWVSTGKGNSKGEFKGKGKGKGKGP